MKLSKENKFTILVLIYFVYFSTKLLIDSYTSIFELLSVVSLGIFSFYEIYIILIQKKQPIIKILYLWFVFVAYVIINSIVNKLEFSFFLRTLYEYIFYTMIMWAGYLFAKKINFNKIIYIFSIFGFFIAVLSFLEFALDFHFIPVENYSTYVQFNGEMVTRAQVFTRSYLSHGVILGIYSLCSCYIYSISKNKIFLLNSIFCYASILTTASRGPLVATTFALFVLNFKYIQRMSLKFRSIGKRKFIVFIMIFFGIAYILLFSDFVTNIDFIDYSLLRIRSIFNWTGDAGNLGRIKIWNSWIGTIKNNILLGIGACKTGSWGLHTLGVTESDFLKKLVELGIIGFSLYYIYIGLILSEFFKNKCSKKIKLCLSVVALVLVESTILQINEEIMVSFYFWFFLGLGLAYTFNTQNESSKKVNVLYFSHVDWNWIKQRPQYIAEGLSNKYNIFYLYQYRYNREIMQETKKTKLDMILIPMFLIPKGDNYKLLSRINGFIKKIYILFILFLENIDIVYLTHPNQINSLPKSDKIKIIYDCMDDHVNFISDLELKNNLEKNESELIRKSKYIICSSEKLLNTIKTRYYTSINKNFVIVRNAFSGDVILNTSLPKNHAKLNVCYFGTISSWFDYSLLLNNVKKNLDVVYWIIGPKDGFYDYEEHPNIKFVGIVEHADLYEKTKKMDCFIMPFKLNKIVESVDPVKFYEYINFNRNIVSIYYKEIERFKPFVYFYNTQKEFDEIIQNLLDNNEIKYSASQRIEFLKDNTWDRRIEQIDSLIEEIK